MSSLPNDGAGRAFTLDEALYELSCNVFIA